MAAACAACGAAPIATTAGPVLSVHSPVVEQGEWEVEFNGGVQGFSGADREHAGKVAIGYGFTSRWRTELELQYSGAPGQTGGISEVELENFFRITPDRERGVIAGWFVELQRDRIEGRTSAKLGPMLQLEGAHTRTNLNLFFERRLNRRDHADVADVDEPDFRDELSYQLQWQYKLQRDFRPGVRAFGSLGSPAHLHSATLRAGPAVFGALRFADRRELEYNAAVLGGMTRDSPDVTVRLQLEYQFR